mgnify:CR=1 FL=1|tara:strand:- start:86 stop:529 length:444 start_codon:yes stop_codon:yes gene_type:complete
MTWSFSESLSTNLDKVRLKLGDTDTNDQILQNETINALLAEHNDDVDLATISCCRAIIAKFNRTIDRNAAGMTANRSIIVDNYRELLSELLRANRGNAGARYSGSFSRDRQEIIEDDSDFMLPFARSGEWDYPGTGENMTDRDADEY